MEFQDSHCITEVSCESGPGVECMGRRHRHILSSGIFLEGGQTRQNERTCQFIINKNWDPLPFSPFLFPSHTLCFLWHLCSSGNWFNSLKWQTSYAIYVVGSFLKFQSIKSGCRRDWCYRYKPWQWIMQFWPGEEEDRSWKERSSSRRKGKTDFIL